VVAYGEGMIDESKIAERYAGLGPELNERQRRLWAGRDRGGGAGDGDREEHGGAWGRGVG
jgi:hypothetical protein